MDLPPLIHAARDTAQLLLAPLPQRWQHTIGVARRAEELIGAIGEDDPSVLVAAAWLHDIGYAPSIVDSGFHPLDGARHLERSGWTDRITGLVAHHSGALYVALVHGLDSELGRYPHEVSPLADALTCADQTVLPDGRRVGIEERLADAAARHAPDSGQGLARQVREPYLRAMAERTEQRLAAAAHHPGS